MSYDPAIGTWVEGDPAGYIDGMDRYRFVDDDPTTLADPTGEYATRKGGTPTDMQNDLVDGGFGTVTVWSNAELVDDAPGAAKRPGKWIWVELSKSKQCDCKWLQTITEKPTWKANVKPPSSYQTNNNLRHDYNVEYLDNYGERSNYPYMGGPTFFKPGSMTEAYFDMPEGGQFGYERYLELLKK